MTWRKAMGPAFFALALGGVLALPQLADEAQLKNKTEQRLDALEREQKRIATALRGHDARLLYVEEFQHNVEESVSRVLPLDARWLRLNNGASEQWDFDEGGRVQVKFLGWDDAGGASIQVKSKAGDVSASFRPSNSLVVVDDMGTSKRTYTTTLHRLQLDRDARAVSALLSVTVK